MLKGSCDLVSKVVIASTRVKLLVYKHTEVSSYISLVSKSHDPLSRVYPLALSTKAPPVAGPIRTRLENFSLTVKP